MRTEKRVGIPKMPPRIVLWQIEFYAFLPVLWGKGWCIIAPLGKPLVAKNLQISSP